MEKILIRDKHPGSATLIVRYIFYGVCDILGNSRRERLLGTSTENPPSQKRIGNRN
jgi:hypothetical protein